jgi:hypothetical protein
VPVVIRHSQKQSQNNMVTYIPFLGPVANEISNHVIAQVVRQWIFNVEAWVQSQSIHVAFVMNIIYSETGFSMTTSVFFCQSSYTNALF